MNIRGNSIFIYFLKGKEHTIEIGTTFSKKNFFCQEGTSEVWVLKLEFLGPLNHL